MRKRNLLLTIILILLIVSVVPSAASAESPSEQSVASISSSTEEIIFPLSVLNLNSYLQRQNEAIALGVHIHSPEFRSYDPPDLSNTGEPRDGLLTAVCTDPGCSEIFSVSVPYGIVYREIRRTEATAQTRGRITWQYDPNKSTRIFTDEEKAGLLDSFDIVSEISLEGHVWSEGVITKTPTCAAKGIMTYTCLDCGVTRTELIKRTNHYDSWVFQNWVEKPTCKNPIGRAAYVCSQCGDDVLFVRGGTDPTLCEHVWDEGEVTLPATETEDGTTTYTCTVCGEKKEEHLHNWVLFDSSGAQDGPKYCSACKTDENEKPLYEAENYQVLQTELEELDEQTLEDFSQILENEEILYCANVEMSSIEDGNVVTEFSENGDCPSFDIPLDELDGIDSTTPLANIHVYHQHEDCAPEEIPECDKMIVDNVLRIFTRDFSTWIVFKSAGDRTIYVSVDWQGTKRDEDSIPVVVTRDGETVQTFEDVTDSCELHDQPEGEYQISVPAGFHVEQISDTSEKLEFKVVRDVYSVRYYRMWEDNEDHYGLRPTLYMAVSISSDGGTSYTEYDRQTLDQFEWQVPKSMKSNGTYVEVGYKLAQKGSSTDFANYSMSTKYHSQGKYRTKDLDETVTNTLKSIDWNVQIKWLNPSRLVLTMPNRVEITVLYSSDNGKIFQQLPNNCDFTMTPADTNSSGNWEAYIMDLPAGYQYRIIEKCLKIGETSYNAVYTDSSKQNGYCYRYEYRSISSSTGGNRTTITNSYNPDAVPLTADQSRTSLWLIVSGISLSLTILSLSRYVMRRRKL